MTVKKVYIADDGKQFDNIVECEKYDKELKEIVLNEIKELDLKIWKKYHPDYDIDDEPDLRQAPMWLHADIVHILVEQKSAEKDIISTIKAAKNYETIINNYLDMARIKDEVNIRMDFLSALKSVKKGSDLSGRIRYALSLHDVSELAKLHKANKCRNKIESLLTSCNYHYERMKFVDKDYDEFL